VSGHPTRKTVFLKVRVKKRRLGKPGVFT